MTSYHTARFKRFNCFEGQDRKDVARVLSLMALARAERIKATRAVRRVEGLEKERRNKDLPAYNRSIERAAKLREKTVELLEKAEDGIDAILKRGKVSVGEKAALVKAIDLIDMDATLQQSKAIGLRGLLRSSW
ncbi:MAG: hypothetical protein KGH69_00880 [Candidatus Micrarchaeota archaeon]|nr:hypothetical protein [Candidatus Micrarchaeota archaeon]